MKIKICALSDTHTKHQDIKIPECDILIHAGDYSYQGRAQEIVSFLNWFDKQPAKHKIFINGNHEIGPEESPNVFKNLMLNFPGITYLEEELVTIEGLKIYGYPITPTFYDWAYMRDRGSPNMLKGLSLIPSNIDILVSHGPAYGILDTTKSNELVGCGDLLHELQRIKPQVMVFGHIHETYGQKEIDGIKYFNVSILDEYYKVKNQPTVFEIDIKNKTE